MSKTILQKSAKYLILIGTLLWIVLVIAAYYLVHKPLLPSQAFNLALAFGQFVVAVGLVSIGGGLGSYLLPDNNLNPLGRLALQAAFGLGVLSIGFLIVGSTLGVNPVLMWGIFLLLGGFFWRSAWRWLKSWKELLLRCYPTSRLEWAIALGVGVILLSTLTKALAPPTKFDTLVYHLSLPQAYLEAGRIVYVPWLFYWGMPQITEMLFTWALTLAGKEAAIVLGWLIGLLALVGLFAYTKQRLGARPAWVAIAALLAGFTTAESLAWGYVGWMSILYGWSFLVVLECWISNGRRRDLLLAGIFAGLALGTKYTNGVLFLVGVGVIVWVCREKSLWEILKNILRFGVVFLVASLPWLIKNFLATGNPAYPLLLPSGGVNQIRLTKYQGQALWGDWRDVIFLPFRATVYGLEGGAGYSASVGPLLLTLGALAWVGWKNRSDEQRSALRIIHMVAGLGLLVWIAAARFSGFLIQSRLYFSLFPVFAILAGAGFDALRYIKLPKIRLQRIVSVLVLLVFFFNVFNVSVNALKQGTLQNVLALQSDHDYLVTNLGWYAVVMKSIRDLPPDARVLMLWETRSLYCAPKCFPDEILDRWYNDITLMQSSEVILQSWRDAGYTHLLYYRLGADYIRRKDTVYQSSDWQTLEILLSSLSQTDEFGDVYVLYSLDS